MVKIRGTKGWNRAQTIVLKLALGLMAVVATLAVGAYLGQALPTEEAEGVTVESSRPTIKQVQELGQLTVLRISIADVLEMSGYDYEGVWIVRGDALVSVDMQSAQFKAVDEAAKKLTVSLPQPEVVQPRVDHENTKTYEVSKATWVPFAGDPDKLRDEAMARAQEFILNARKSEENIELARAQAESMLADIYEPAGWRVEVVWE